MADLTVDAIRAVLATAGFVEYDGDQFGFTVNKAAFGNDFSVWLRGIDLLPFNPGEGPRALLDDYATALKAAGYSVRTPGTMVIVGAEAEASVAECGYCTARITFLGGSWTDDDGTIACLANPNTSASYAPHKPKEG